ncbi:MAG TPA: hypothetical protein VJ990_07775 [Clostridia bacterium]|nr:hypothetical protein [Clostridia bacterium]
MKKTLTSDLHLENDIEGRFLLPGQRMSIDELMGIFKDENPGMIRVLGC